MSVTDIGLTRTGELWLHDHHWSSNEVTIAAAGAGGQQLLGSAVATGMVRRVRELTIRHAGTHNTVVTLILSGGAVQVTIDVPAQTTRTWSSQDGRDFAAGTTPGVRTSDVTDGSTFVSASGVEAAKS